MWCRLRICQLNKSWCRCRCKWDVTIEYLTHAIFEKQLTALHVVRTFHRFNRYADRDQNCSFDLIYFNVQGCTRTDFSICALYCYWLSAWGPANFYREKRRVSFVTSHLFSFLVVLSLICLVTTKILICGNQTTWRLEILLRTIVAALLKTKYNGRFVQNKRYQETGKEYFTIVQMIVKDDGY